MLLEVVVDAPPGDPESEVRRDVPLSFDPVRREYGWREVVRHKPVEVLNPDGRLEPDFLAVHGGG